MQIILYTICFIHWLSVESQMFTETTAALSSNWTGTTVYTQITDNPICPGTTNNNCWDIASQGYVERTVNTFGYMNVELTYSMSSDNGLSGQERCDLEYSTNTTIDYTQIDFINGKNVDKSSRTFNTWTTVDNIPQLTIRLTNVRGGCHCYFNDLILSGSTATPTATPTTLTGNPTTATPTTSIPTTTIPTTAVPTTTIPTTATPTTVNPTTYSPTTFNPTISPSQPTSNPITIAPTIIPTINPTITPTSITNTPTTSIPTTVNPTVSPITITPTLTPTDKTWSPTNVPTIEPTQSTVTPTQLPTNSPSNIPTTAAIPVGDKTTIASDSGNDNDASSASFGTFAGSLNGILMWIGISVSLLCIIIIIIFMFKKNQNNKATNNTQSIRKSIDDHQQITASSPKSYSINTNEMEIQMEMGSNINNNNKYINTNDDEKQSEYITAGGPNNNKYINENDDEMVLITGNVNNVTAGGPDPEIEDDYKGMDDDGDSDNDVLINSGHITMGGPEIEDDYKQEYKQDVELEYGDGGDDSDDDVLINTGHITMGGPQIPAVNDDDDDSDDQVLIGAHVTMGGPNMDDDDENVPPPPEPPVEYIQEDDSDDDNDVLAGMSTLQ